MRKIAALLVCTAAYFAGAWLFFAIIQNCQVEDLGFFAGFLLILIAYVCYTILVLLFTRHIIGIQSIRILQLMLGAFIGLSAFLFSLDGIGSLVRSNSYSQLLSQFAIPAIGALVSGGVALGFGIFTQAPHQEEDRTNYQ